VLFSATFNEEIIKIIETIIGSTELFNYDVKETENTLLKLVGIKQYYI
jgi:hypothetical protein